MSILATAISPVRDTLNIKENENHYKMIEDSY